MDVTDLLLRRRELMMGKTHSDDNYIQDGLVFHLDGADATANEWVERVNGYVFTLTNTTLDVVEGGVVFDGSNSYGRCVTTGDFMANTHTIEAAFNFAGNIGTKPNNGIFTNQVNGGIAMGTYSEIWDGIGITTNRWNETFSTGKQVISIKPTVFCYKNKKSVAKSVNDSFGRDNAGGMWVGSRVNTTYPFLGTIYQIRIYNRKLTEEEVLHNQTIDINKYNITI